MFVVWWRRHSVEISNHGDVELTHSFILYLIDSLDYIGANNIRLLCLVVSWILSEAIGLLES